MFKDILGQNKTKTILINQIKNQKLSHAYLFIGQDRVGKKTAAFEFAKILNCSKNDWTKTQEGACGQCPSCVKISKNIHPDIHLIDFQKQIAVNEDATDKTRKILIETIKKAAIDRISETKREAKWRFFIIDRAETMTPNAADSFLKTLEEPSENNIIILTARHKETLPQTILSRCRILFFAPLKQADIISYLVKNNIQTPGEAQKSALISEGSMPDFSAGVEVKEKEQEIDVLIKTLASKKLPAHQILDLYKSKSRDEAIEFIDLMFNRLKSDFRAEPDKFMSALEIISKCREMILKNINSQLAFDNMFFEINSMINGVV